MYYTEIVLIALIVAIANFRPRLVLGGLGKAILVVAVLLVARYTNRNSGILAAIVAIALIHISHDGIEGMDVNPDAKPAPPLTDNKTVEETKKKLSKTDLECISRALRSCSSNEMPINRDAVGSTNQAPEGTIANAGKGTESFYA